MYVDDIKLAVKKQNLDPMWKLLDKEVDLGEPTSFLDHAYLGCSPNIDDHLYKEEDLKSEGELSKISSQIIPTCLNLACIGRLDILWSAKNLHD